MTLFENTFNAEEIAAGIAEWVSIEIPSFDASAVNHMMDVAAEKMQSMGATIDRTPGSEGYGDVLRARFSCEEGPGILILGHLDTVHLVGTLASSLPVKRDGDRLYGPGTVDMKGGVYLAIHALEKVIEMQGPLSAPVTFMLIPDEEVGSPSTRALIESEAKANRYVLVPEPAKPGKFVTGRHAFCATNFIPMGVPLMLGSREVQEKVLSA